MAGPAEELDVEGVAVRLSSPDKIYYPKLGVDGGTKRHLVDYYRTVATHGALLNALRDRPTHLQRFPDGVEGEEIYQKRVPAKRPEHVESCEVTFPSGRKADVLRVRSAANIVWAANLGNITFHPWAVRCPDVDHPDELRIDLDPQPGTGFDDARAIALDVMRPLLDELGLIGFPKTSTEPLSYFNSGRMQLMAVVLPDPFGPSSPNTSPSLTSRLKWSSAIKSPYLLTRLFTLTTICFTFLHLISDRIIPQTFVSHKCKTS